MVASEKPICMPRICPANCAASKMKLSSSPTMIPMSSSLSAMPVHPRGETCTCGSGTTGQSSTTQQDDEGGLGAGGHGAVAEAGGKQQQAGDAQPDEDGGGQDGFEGEGMAHGRVHAGVIATRAGNRKRDEW